MSYEILFDGYMWKVMRANSGCEMTQFGCCESFEEAVRLVEEVIRLEEIVQAPFTKGYLEVRKSWGRPNE